MGERGIGTDECSRRIPDFAENEIAGRRHGRAIGIGCPVECDDAAIGKELAQMVEGTAIAKPELQHGTIKRSDCIGYGIEDVALCAQAANETIQAAHRI